MVAKKKLALAEPLLSLSEREGTSTKSFLSSAHWWKVRTIIGMIGVRSTWGPESIWEVFTLQRWTVVELQQGEPRSLASVIIMLSYRPPPSLGIVTLGKCYNAKPRRTIFPYALPLGLCALVRCLSRPFTFSSLFLEPFSICRKIRNVMRWKFWFLFIFFTFFKFFFSKGCVWFTRIWK